MSRALHHLRKRIEHAPVNRRGYRSYARALRRDIEEHAVIRRAEGESYNQIAAELGMASATLVNWCKKSSSKTEPAGRPIGFRPVVMRNDDEPPVDVVDQGALEPAAQPVVVLPSGVRVEGISLDELPGFLGRLECRF